MIRERSVATGEQAEDGAQLVYCVSVCVWYGYVHGAAQLIGFGPVSVATVDEAADVARG